MKKYLLIVLLFGWQISLAQNVETYKSYNPAEAKSPVIEGRAWHTDLSLPYDRLPAKAEKTVRPEVWRLSHNSAGEYIRFKSNAPELVVQYKVTGNISMNHMPATGVSGVDLYALDVNNTWHWVKGNFSFGDTIVYKFSNFFSAVALKEFRLYLPLYNTLEWMLIDVPQKNTFEPVAVSNEKPIVLYGTSIMQGACASRPGLAWGNILGRRLNKPVVNLGFSGNGRLEEPLINLMNETDASLFVLDCQPNLHDRKVYTAGQISERIISSVKNLRSRHPQTPVLLVEHCCGLPGVNMDTAFTNRYKWTSDILSGTFEKLKAGGEKNIYLLTANQIDFDAESTVDGTHPTDIGMMKYADAYEKAIRKIPEFTTHNLQFDSLAKKWDEAMPLGNGMLGALIWEKDKRLRISMDRADLWDERKALNFSGFTFKWVEAQVLKKDYGPVQKKGDYPYDNIPYPTKLPAAAMEFDISSMGKVVSNLLEIKTAINTVIFENGVVFKCYIDATRQQGNFIFENTDKFQTEDLTAAVPRLIIHNYNSGKNESQNDNSHAGEGLGKLGYATGTITNTGNSIRYRQPTYEGHYYEVYVEWKNIDGKKVIGNWTISRDEPARLSVAITAKNQMAGFNTHIDWWKNFWDQSSIDLPDQAIEKQYYLELYKLGSAARAGAPAITLQAVWTADNGSLPPWKGDFHNDLNTQLSYWPSYTGNHLAEGATFTDWLWKIKPKNHQYTRQYFGVEGLNVPGVVTLGGDPMGGWIQYALSPTVSAWCAQHFYWQWKYSMDEQFLKNRAYPYIHDAATYLENITRYKNGVRKLPLSSSPEYNDNDITAWYHEWSNFDLSLAKFLFTVASEVAMAAKKPAEADHWLEIYKQLPAYEINETGFTIAPGQNLNSSHRHMSQYMAIYPLALLDINNAVDKIIIENSLQTIAGIGTSAWCGYTFSWMASLYARAYKADSAAKQLQIFASNFCSPNSFHLNGDQKGGEYSNFTYRPFTLEGNFAFAQGVHELLLQSRKGYLQVFPALPAAWKDVSFTNLRGEGAFLVSAKKENGVPVFVKVLAEQGGTLRIRLPFKTWIIRNMPSKATTTDANGLVSVTLKKGEIIVFENGYE